MWAQPSAAEAEAIRKEVDITPAPADLSSFLRQIPPLGRRLRVAAPCVGIHGCGQSLLNMGVGADTINIFDLESGYKHWLDHHLREMGMQVADIELHLGKILGNLLKLPLDRLALPCDLLCCGPPCPPWSGLGNRGAMSDPRALVFVRIVIWIVILSHSGGLLMAIVENVKGVLHSHHGLESAMDIFMRVLNTHVPFFHWRVDTLELQNYLAPQTRVRTFLRGMRRSIVSQVPAPLPAFGRRLLKDCLGPFPCTDRGTLSAQQQINLKVYEAKIKERVVAGSLQQSDVVTIAVDRQDDRTFPQKVTVNAVPTLTTNNTPLWVVSVGCVVRDIPDQSRTFFRKLKETERLTLQSFPASLAMFLGSLTLKAAGNAYPPALITVVLNPMLMALDRFDLAAWPSSLPLGPPAGLVRQVQADLSAKPRVIDKRKFAKFVAESKRCRQADHDDSD